MWRLDFLAPLNLACHDDSTINIIVLIIIDHLQTVLDFTRRSAILCRGFNPWPRAKYCPASNKAPPWRTRIVEMQQIFEIAITYDPTNFNTEENFLPAATYYTAGEIAGMQVCCCCCATYTKHPHSTHYLVSRRLCCCCCCCCVTHIRRWLADDETSGFAYFVALPRRPRDAKHF